MTHPLLNHGENVFNDPRTWVIYSKLVQGEGSDKVW